MTHLPPHSTFRPMIIPPAPPAPACLNAALPQKDKVMAYITQGRRLLVSRHPNHPQAGIQVPGGSLESGESLETAILREVQEETGLTLLSAPRFLAWQWVDVSPYGKPELHRRCFFHLVCHQNTPPMWRHWEKHPSDGSTEPIPLDWYWVPAPGQIPELTAMMGGLLPMLWRQLDWPTSR